MKPKIVEFLFFNLKKLKANAWNDSIFYSLATV